MTAAEEQLNRLLVLVADRIDLDHSTRVEKRYRAALAWQPVDRTPLVVQAPFPKTMALPEPWCDFRRYPYRDAFEDPVAMLQNVILSNVVPGLLLRDDNPLAIRNDHGTIQIAAVLGGHWRLYRDDYPWVTRFDSIESIRRIAESDEPVDLSAGVLPRSFQTLAYYREKLDQHQPCPDAIQISMPDLQGSIDTAEQLWGGDIFLACCEEPDLVTRLMRKIVKVMLAVEARYRDLVRDRFDPEASTQHGYVIPGRLLIRADTGIMLSPQMYADLVCPHDSEVLHQVGGGSIHFCGDGHHLVPRLLDIPRLRGLDFGNPEKMDMAAIYRACEMRKVALTGLLPSREELVIGKARRDFPTGCVFVYNTESFDDAQQLVQSYCSA